MSATICHTEPAPDDDNDGGGGDDDDDDDEYGAVGGKSDRLNRRPPRKPAPVPLCPPQI
jgi:hypothetical protein